MYYSDDIVRLYYNCTYICMYSTVHMYTQLQSQVLYYYTVLYYTVLYCTVLYCMILCCAVLVLYCTGTVLYYILYCIILYCTGTIIMVTSILSAICNTQIPIVQSGSLPQLSRLLSLQECPEIQCHAAGTLRNLAAEDQYTVRQYMCTCMCYQVSRNIETPNVYVYLHNVTRSDKIGLQNSRGNALFLSIHYCIVSQVLLHVHSLFKNHINNTSV